MSREPIKAENWFEVTSLTGRPNYFNVVLVSLKGLSLCHMVQRVAALASSGAVRRRNTVTSKNLLCDRTNRDIFSVKEGVCVCVCVCVCVREREMCTDLPFCSTSVPAIARKIREEDGKAE